MDAWESYVRRQLQQTIGRARAKGCPPEAIRAALADVRRCWTGKLLTGAGGVSGGECADIHETALTREKYVPTSRRVMDAIKEAKAREVDE